MRYDLNSAEEFNLWHFEFEQKKADRKFFNSKHVENNGRCFVRQQ